MGKAIIWAAFWTFVVIVVLLCAAAYLAWRGINYAWSAVVS